jgi:hypothetical protein
MEFSFILFFYHHCNFHLGTSERPPWNEIATLRFSFNARSIAAYTKLFI